MWLFEILTRQAVELAFQEVDMAILFKNYQNEIIKLRRYIHSNPELSLNEYTTADYIEKYLNENAILTQRIGECGITAVIYSGNPAAKVIAVRAEMDAIAVEEENDIEYKSRNKGVSHACGHDAIMACALVLAKICNENKKSLNNTIKFIFQPAEENGEGTDIMLNGGVMSSPDVDYFLMFHFVNDAAYGMEVQYGSASAAIGKMEVVIKGKSAHWCNSDKGVDAIVASSEFILKLNELNSTYTSDLPFITGIGTINGGSAKNVIASDVYMEGTLRASKTEDYYKLYNKIFDIASEIEEKYCVKINMDITEEPIPPIINDKYLVNAAIECGEKIWGKNCRLVDKHFLSGDSASFYFDYAKGLFIVFTAEIQGKINYPIHNGKFNMDESRYYDVVQTLYSLIQTIE